MVDMKALFNAQVDIRVVSATADMLSEHFGSEYNSKENHVSMALERYEMYGQVLASICGQLRQLTSDLEAISG